jgi:MFS transporter, ACS family, glucarate transporter
MNPPPEHSHARWNLLALLVAASFVAYLLRSNMSVAGEAMMGDLGISEIQLGIVLAAFAWGYAIFQFPGGVFGDAIGGRKALTIMAVLWGGLTLLTALVPSPRLASPTAVLAGLAGIRFLMGAAQAPLYPVTSGGTTCLWFPVTGWAFPNGLTNAGLTLGSAATGPLIAWLMVTVGWRQSFVVTAPIAFLLAGVWWWYVRDRPAEHPGVSPAELALINAGRPDAHAQLAEPGAWRRVLVNRQILLLTASYFCSNYVFYFFFNWLFIYLVRNRGFKALEGGVYASLPWIMGAVGALVGGIWSDRLSKRRGIRLGTRIPCVVGLILAGVLILLASSAQDPRVAVGFLSLCLACQQMTEGAFWAAAIGVSGRHASAGCGILNTGGNAVGGVGALMVPLVVKALGWPAALASASIFALAGAILWLFIDAESRMTEPAPQ